MTPDEIWLRLMKVSSLYGDRMVEVAQRLCAAASVDRERAACRRDDRGAGKVIFPA